MSFLHYLDVLIGYALAMAVLATLIGSAAAGWLTLIRTRTRHLQAGLATVLDGIQELKGAESSILAGALMMDRAVKARGIGTGWMSNLTDADSVPGKLVRFIREFSAETIQREELPLILLRRAVAGDELSLKALGSGKTIQEAKALLSAVEKAMLKYEAADPSQPSQVWRTKALADTVPALAASIFSQFDEMMDRLEDNVRSSSKAAAFVFSAIFLCIYPVNSIDILNRLSSNSELRAQAVDAASGVKTDGGKAEVSADLKNGLFGDVLNKPDFDPYRSVSTPGVLATWVMVSLGAPFWLTQLGRLLGLRSAMAKKAEDQRTLRDRDTSSTAPAADPGQKRGGS